MTARPATEGRPARSPADVDAIGAAIVGLDRDARDLERRWGVGRLVILADDLLRERFIRQRRKLDQAIAEDAPASEVIPHVEATRRGWQALERAALAAGHAPKPPDVWEVRLSDGSVVAIARDNADASIASADGRQLTVYTLDEIARLIERFPQIVTAKRTFPGAIVEAIRTRPPIDWDRGEDLPW